MNPPVSYDSKTFWKEEFKRRPGERIALRNGDVLEPGERFEDPAYCAAEGKKRAKNVATVSFFMLPGLDAVSTERPSPTGANVVVIQSHDYRSAAYDFERRLALDDSGAEEKSALQMGAVLAGERERLRSEDAGAPLALQYASAYDEARTNPTPPNLVRACDCFMVWAREKDVYPTFCAEELSGHLQTSALDREVGPLSNPFANPERLRLTSATLSGGEALVEAIFASGGNSGAALSRARVRALIGGVRGFAEDLTSYERLVYEDLARARADLGLARETLSRLLVEDDTGSRARPALDEALGEEQPGAA